MTSNWSPDSVNVPPPTRDPWGLGAAGTSPGAGVETASVEPLPYGVPDATLPAVQPVFAARTQTATPPPVFPSPIDPGQHGMHVAIPPPAGFPPPAYAPPAAGHPLAPAAMQPAYPAPPLSLPPGGYGPAVEATDYGRGPMPSGPYPPIHTRPQPVVPHQSVPTGDASLGRGATMGVLAAAMLGIAWFAIAVASGYQISYLGFLLGGGVALSVAKGTGRGGFDVAAAAIGITVPAMAIIQYFIARHFLGAEVVGSDTVPLWLGVDGVKDMVDLYLVASPRVLLFWGFSLLGAVKVATQRVGV